MNILITISSLSFGGAEKQAVLDANLLAADHSVTLIAFKDGSLRNILKKEVDLKIIQKKGYINTAINLRRIILKKKIDVIHASLFAPMIISSIAAWYGKSCVFWHFHSHEYDMPLKSKIAFYVFSQIKNVKKILFVNHELLSYFSYLKFPQTKTAVLYNHSEIVLSGKSVNHKVKDKINIGFVGRVISLKRVHYLVELASHLISKKYHQFIIHVVGDGEDLNRIKKLISHQNLSNYFLIHGFQTVVQQYYSAFDFFVNPSSEECLSIAMIDAGMMSLPIVAFDVGGNNEIVVNNKTGFIVNSPEEFFEKCFLLIADNDSRLQMGNAAHIHCKNLFCEQTHKIELEKLYRETACA